MKVIYYKISVGFSEKFVLSGNQDYWTHSPLEAGAKAIKYNTVWEEKHGVRDRYFVAELIDDKVKLYINPKTLERYIPQNKLIKWLNS